MNKKVETNSLDYILDQVQNIETRSGIAELGTIMMNALMSKEREIFLREETENKANGFYQRKLASALGSMGLSVPRDRNSSFRPSIIPDPYKRMDPSFEDLLVNLILQSYSPNKIKGLLRRMNLPYSIDEVNEIKEDLFLKAQELKAKQLPENSLSIFIDAYKTDLKDIDTGRVKKAVIYTIIGIDLSGHKDVYGYYIFFGSETKEDWLSIFNDLISRGLKRIALIVSDAFPGLDKAVGALFPKSHHQLCFIHLQRNVRRNMAKPDAKIFNGQLSIIRKLDDFEQALSKFEKLCEKFSSKYKSFIPYLLSKKDLYFNFIHFPEPIRKHIYTTNIVENFNSRLEVSRVNSGGYFQSTKTADVAIYIIINNLNQNKWKNPIPAFREAQYEINQMFNLKFEGVLNDNNSKTKTQLS